MILDQHDTLSQEAYVSLCEWLFGLWFGPEKLYYAEARAIARRQLTILHKSYSDSQACPVWFAEAIRSRTLNALDRFNRAVETQGFYCNFKCSQDYFRRAA